MKYISLNFGIRLHWWGDKILLVDNRERYYVMEDIETLFTEHIFSHKDLKSICNDISLQMGIKKEEVLQFVDIFMENFADYFHYDSDNNQGINITGKKNAYYPMELLVSLTNDCVHRCVHCYKNAGEKHNYIDSDALCEFLDTMQGYVPKLTFTGGEPTLHPDFIYLVDKYASLYELCTMTSGYKLKKEVFEALKKMQRGIIISIYSLVKANTIHFQGEMIRFTK